MTILSVGRARGIYVGISTGISTGAPRIRVQLVAGTNPEGRRPWDISVEGDRPLSILKRPTRFIRLSAAAGETDEDLSRTHKPSPYLFAHSAADE